MCRYLLLLIYFWASSAFPADSDNASSLLKWTEVDSDDPMDEAHVSVSAD